MLIGIDGGLLRVRVQFRAGRSELNLVSTLQIPNLGFSRRVGCFSGAVFPQVVL